MKDNNIKRICRIIITFPGKLLIMIFCTIFLPLIWVFEDTLSIYEYFITWRAVFLEKDIPDFYSEYEEKVYRKGE